MIGNKLEYPGTFVAIDNAKFYMSGESEEANYIDAGNITEADVKQYNSFFREAIDKSTQGV
jgi:hypothetical protein